MSPDQPLADTRVTVLGTYSGGAASAFLDEMERFTDGTGIQVRFDGVADLVGLPDAMQEAGFPIDLVLVPQPSLAADRGRRGEAIDLGVFLDVDGLRDDRSPALVSLGTVGSDGTWPAPEGAVYSAAVGLNVKSLVWYPVPQFEDAGYEIPTTLDELVALAEQIVADGRTPWCHGEVFGPTVGFPGTDWIEDLVLHEAGPDVYDQWVTHDIPFDDPAVRAAFERFDSLVLADGHLYGGRETAVELNVNVAQHPMFEDPPGCWLYRFPSFAQGWLPFGVESGVDTAFFPFPAVAAEYGGALVGGGEFVFALTDRPEVRELVRYMMGSDFGSELLKINDTYISANRRFPLDEYTNEVTRELAELAYRSLEQDTFRFDGSDLMPFEVGGFLLWEAMAEFTRDGPDNLDEILKRVEAAWVELEQSDP